jgi:GTP cyclohydrolase FolE2
MESIHNHSAYASIEKALADGGNASP